MAKNSFVNVGRLVVELQEYEEKYWHYNVVCWVQDEEDFRALGIVGKGLDEDGDLRIELEEMEDAASCSSTRSIAYSKDNNS